MTAHATPSVMPHATAAPKRTTRARHRGRSWLADILVALLATALLVAWSAHAGRLALPPQYDDVAYLRQALQWVHILNHDGFAGLLSVYRQQPAHAPLHDLVGALSFLLLGIHDWAPYAGRVIIVLLLLRIGRRLLPDLPPPLRWGMIAVVLTTPFVGTLVTEFRPDPIYGLLLATAMLFVLIRPLADATWRRCAGAGLLFAAVLLIKTSTYPQTLAFMLGVLFLRLAADWASSRPLAPGLRRALLIAAVAIAVPLPHYLLAWKIINYYIQVTLFGERRHLWVLPGDTLDHLLYYLTGPGGRTQIGLRLWVLLGIVLTSALAIWRHRPGARATGAILLLTLATTFALPTINPTKSLFLGMTFNFMLLLGGLWLLNTAFVALRDTQGPRRASQTIVTLLVCAFALWLPRAPIAGLAEGDPAERRRIAMNLFDAIRPHARDGTHLMFTASGTLLNPDLLAYWTLRHDDQRISPELNIFTDDLDVHRRALRRSDLVVAGERLNGEANPDHASSKAQVQTLALARSMPELVEFAEIPAHYGRSYHLFIRADQLVDDAFAGFTDATGLSAPAGPFPQHRLPVMRSGTGDATTLAFDNPTGRPVVLLIDAMTLPPARTIRLRLNGQPVGDDLTFDPVQQFRSFAVNLRASTGRNELVITYSPPGNAGEKIVHYRRLQLVSRPAIQHYQ